MATAIAASRPAEAVMMSEVNDTSSHQLNIATPQNSDITLSDAPSPHPSPRINLPVPPPNPPFVFPVRPSSSAPSSFSRATGRRPRSAIEIPGRISDFAGGVANPPSQSPGLPDFSFNPSANLSPDAANRPSRSPTLPDFSFNPGAVLSPDESLLSPPLSPQSPMISPNRTGHRRGGSEFVGGKLRSGGSITIMNTSPTTSESGFASPKLSPADAPPRRGHAHRRSGAISSHDLTMILKPNNSTALRGSSAPTSPADVEDKFRIPEPAAESKPEPAPQQTDEKVAQEIDAQPTLQSNPSPDPIPRTRVGFSDTLEFIPRPLSLVSTDTSSTIRPGHKVSGSISSIISANTAATDRDPQSLIGSPVSRTKNDSRPSTAGAVLERTPSLHVLNGDSLSPRRRNSIPLLAEIPKSDSELPASPSPSKTPRRWSFFGLEPFVSAASPTKLRPISSGSSNTSDKNLKSANSSTESKCRSKVDNGKTHSDFKKTSGKKKRQKKVKSWAGSILTRKSKTRSQKSKSMRRRSQTPPNREIGDLDDGLGMSEAPVPPLVMVTEPSQSEADEATTKPGRLYEDDIAYPMIDLDAALGPFNTPSTRDPQWEEAQRAGAPPKRQLHSAAGMRGFSGPGMHYHRRAESAPEMPPFEAGRFGIHRFGSSSTMADVFEEDEEEDEDLSAQTPSEESASEARDGSADEFESTSSSEDGAASTPTQEREPSKVSPKEILQTLASIKRKGSGSSLDMQRPGSRMRTENPSGLREEVIAEEPSYVTFRRDFDLQAASAVFNSDEPSPSPRMIPSNELDQLELTPVTVSGSSAMPSTPYSVGYSSSFPSPRSPMSYDAHRISTAPSSITDENNYHALLMGEPGPELVRISVDVPSLTSSNSTMTRESTSFPGVRPRNMPFHDQRPASFSSTPFGRRRSSLVSLSRLISSAHGERSKLSMEVPLDSEPEKKPKVSKSKRLSRMMQFWKPRASSES